MRKKHLFFLMLIALITTKINAQVKDNLSVGPIAGFGHSCVINSNDAKFKPVLNIGGRLVYSASPKLGFGLDAAFRTEGEKAKNFNPAVSSNLNYIRLDPKLLYFFGEYDHAFRPKVGVGPSFGFLVGGKSDHILFMNGNDATRELDSKDYYEGFDVGLSALLGFNYRLKSKTWLNIDANYNHGLSNVVKNNRGDAIQNRSLFVNVGVTFGIGYVGEK